MAAREAVRHARQEAEGAREHMEQARRVAQSQAGSQYAPDLWNEAEVKATEAATALAREEYLEARQSYEVAITVYRRFEEAAREARATGVRGRRAGAFGGSAQPREDAQAEGAAQYAREQWDAAEAKSSEAESGYDRNVVGRADEIFNEAIALYGRAEEAAREARQREFRRAEEARRQGASARDRAQAAGAPHYTRAQWDAAEARLSEAEAAFVRRAYAQARQAFDGAAAAYRSLEESAREALSGERDVAEHARERMVQARRAEELRAAPQYAPGLRDEAEAKSAEAEAAFGREAYTEAIEAFEAAAAAYRRVEEAAREARERQAAERARARMEQVRERAQTAGAARYTRELWATTEAKFAEAQATFFKKSLGLAAGIFDECTVLYARAEEASHEARGAERRRAEAARARATQGRSGDIRADAPRHATSLENEAAAKFADAEAAFSQEQYATAADEFDRALALYQEAEKQAREARRGQREEAEQTRRTMAERRRLAAAFGAASHAASAWQEAEASAASGEAAFAREAYAEASRAFHRSADIYHRTEERARDAVRALEETIRQSERALESPTVLAEPPTVRIDAPTEQVEAPTVLAEPEVLVEAATVLDGPPAAAAHAPRAPVGALPPRYPTRWRGKSAIRVTVVEVGKPAPGSRWGLRRVAMAAVGGLAVIGLGALLWLPRGPSTAPSPGPPVEQGQSGSPTSTASPPLERAAGSSALSPSSRMVDSPLTPRRRCRRYSKPATLPIPSRRLWSNTRSASVATILDSASRRPGLGTST